MTVPSAVACCANLAFVVLVAYAHLVRRDLARASTPLSAYFSQPTRGAMLAAYLCLAIALAGTALYILPQQAGAIVDGVGAASGGLLLVAAVCLVPIALTTNAHRDADARSERTRTLHRVFTRIAFSAVVLAMLAYSLLGMPGDSRGARALRTDAILLAVFAAMTFALSLRLPPGSPHYGTIQKVLVALIAAWIWLAALA